MQKLIKYIIFAAALSVIHFVPARGQEIQDIIICQQMIADMEKKDKELKQSKLINEKPKTKYTKVSLNIRSKPSAKSKIKGTLRYNEKVKVIKHSKKWSRLISKKGKTSGYVRSKYLSKKPRKSREYEIPEYSGMKSWMDYRKITDTSSPQYKLQQEYAETGDYGLRTVDGRYCVAIGYAFEPKIGQYFDLVLENGTVIPCIISDEKRRSDTDSDNIFTYETDCCSEFVVDNESLSTKAHLHGDISDVNEDWDSPVEYIKIYTKKNVLED